MSNKSYFRINEEHDTNDINLPKALFISSKYRELSNDAKLLYALLSDRIPNAITNNCIDNNGHVYIIYTNKELADLLNCDNNKIVKLKSELEKVDLLIQKAQGMYKPNHLYLLKPDVSSDDILKYINMSDK